MRTTLLAVLILVLAAPVAFAHPERHAFFPDGSVGAVPKFRSQADQVLYVCKKGSAKRIKRAFRGHPKLKRKRLRQLKALRVPPHPGRRQRGQERGDHPHHAGRLPGAAARRTPEPDARCANDYDEIGSSLLASGVAGHGRRREGRQLRVPAQVPERAEPDRDHRRRAGRRPRLRPQVQPPDRGHGPPPARRVDLRPAHEAQRDPGRPRRRHRTCATSRSSTPTSTTSTSSRPTASGSSDITSRYSREYGFLSFTSDNGLYDRLDAFGSRRLRRSTPAPAPRATATATGSRSARQLAPQHDRLLGHGRQRRVGARQPLPPQRDRHDDRLVRVRPSRACRRTARSGSTTGSTPTTRTTSTPSATRTARTRRSAERNPKIVCPTFQVPVGTGIAIFGGNRDIVRNNHIWDNWRDGMKLLFVPAAFRGEPDKGSTRRSTTSSPTTTSACGPTARAIPTATTSGGTRRAAATAGPATPARQRGADLQRRHRPAGLPGLERLQPRHPHQDRQPGHVRDLGSVREPGPARL